MKIDATTRYDIKAEAFRRMTGHMAPGKDASPLSYPAPIEQRAQAFDEWLKQFGPCVDAMLAAFSVVIGEGHE